MGSVGTDADGYVSDGADDRKVAGIGSSEGSGDSGNANWSYSHE